MWRRRRQAAASRLTCVSSSPAAARVTPRPLSDLPLLALLALLCVQPARAQGAGTGAPPETGTISGVVTTEGTGTPPEIVPVSGGAPVPAPLPKRARSRVS